MVRRGGIAPLLLVEAMHIVGLVVPELGVLVSFKILMLVARNEKLMGFAFDQPKEVPVDSREFIKQWMKRAKEKSL